MVVSTMTLILILSASAYITGAATVEVGGDVAAWRKGKEPPSHQRWMKNHERKMEKLRQTGEAGNASSAAPGYAKRVLDNAVQRWADRSAQKTREQQQFLREYGSQLADDKTQRKIRRHDAWEKRRRDLADLFGAAWDNTAESIRQRQAHDRNDLLGPLVTDAAGEPDKSASTDRANEPVTNTDSDRADAPSTLTPSGITVTISDETLRRFTEEARRQREHEREMARNNAGRGTGGQDDTDPGQQRPPSSPQPPPAPDPGPVQAHAERVQPDQPTPSEPTPIESAPAAGADGAPIEDADVVDDPHPEVVEEETASDDTTPLATVHTIHSKKEGPDMALEGGYTAAADKMDTIVDYLTQFTGVTTSTYDAFSGEKWTGEPMDLLESGNTDLKNALNKLSKSAAMIRQGGNAVQDSYAANSFVGSDTSVRNG